MEYKFKKGDVVKLKAGSARMTVTGNAHASNGNVIIPDRYECTWFDGERVQKAVFAASAMELIKRE